jgi:hypothetical protein
MHLIQDVDDVLRPDPEGALLMKRKAFQWSGLLIIIIHVRVRTVIKLRSASDVNLGSWNHEALPSLMLQQGSILME